MCLTPLTLFRREGMRKANDYMSDIVPCGRCPECIKTRKLKWVYRLQQENKVSKTAAFLTLTYDDDHLPIKNGVPTLLSKHHTDFIKRIRKRTGVKGIKYYSCGEYGTRTNRPHYHSIIFNVPFDTLATEDDLKSIWMHGHVDVGDVTDHSIAYVAGYVNKKIVDNDRYKDGRLPEFSRMSKGLGKSYLSESVKKYHKKKKNPFIVMEDGKKLPLPRYYKEKLFDEQEQRIVNRKGQEYIQQNPQWQDAKNELEWKEREFNKSAHNERINRLKL